MKRSNLPSSWQWATIGEIGAVISGGTPKTSEPANFEGNIPWITPADLTGYKSKLIASGKRNISRRGLAASSARVIPKRSVLFSSRAPIGYVAIAENDITTNQGFKSVSLHNGLNEEYIYYYLKSAKSIAESQASGTTFKEISGSRFARLPVPIAPKLEQHRVVERIETLFARIDKGEEVLREVRRLIKRYRKTILKAAVTGSLIGRNWRDLEQVPLGDLLLDIRYGTSKKCGRDSSQTPVLRIPNVVSGEIDIADLKFTNLSGKDRDKLSLRRGDILLVRSNGSANLVARGAIVDEKAVGCAYAGYLIRLRIDQDRIRPQFLKLVLDSPQMRSVIERQARSTSGVHNINSSETKNLSIPVPPLDEQMAVTTEVESLFADIQGLEAMCEAAFHKSNALRQSILKSAFSGQLVPQDPNDEPACELLSRIRAEREAVPKSRPPKKASRKKSARRKAGS